MWWHSSSLISIAATKRRAHANPALWRWLWIVFQHVQWFFQATKTKPLQKCQSTASFVAWYEHTCELQYSRAHRIYIFLLKIWCTQMASWFDVVTCIWRNKIWSVFYVKKLVQLLWKLFYIIKLVLPEIFYSQFGNGVPNGAISVTWLSFLNDYYKVNHIGQWKKKIGYQNWYNNPDCISEELLQKPVRPVLKCFILYKCALFFLRNKSFRSK